MRMRVIGVATIVALAVIGVLAGVSNAPGRGEAVGGGRIEKVDIDAQGNEVVGVKDFTDRGEGWPEQHYYQTGPFFSSASAQDAAEITSLLRRSLELEYAAMLTANSGAKVEGIKKECVLIYSDAKGDLAKHLGYIDTNAALLRQDGYAQTELKLTRFEVKSIEVQGDAATAIIEEESYGVRRRTANQPTPETLSITGGRQIKFYLERQAGSWLILGESWAFLPGLGV